MFVELKVYIPIIIINNIKIGTIASLTFTIPFVSFDIIIIFIASFNFETNFD